jgi:signal peptidase I
LLLIVGRALLMVALVRTFIGEASVVPTGSMEGTILVGDHLFWNKAFYGPEIPFTHWRLPQLKSAYRGEIVAFHYPGDPSQIFLKRVVAVGGDRIFIRDGVLFVNGEPISESYAVHTQPVAARFEQMASRTVPLGELFMLGDNRDNSSDSRDWGAVPVQNVIGSPLFIFWSYDAPSAAWLDSRPSSRLRFYGSIALHMFSRTRWSRMGTLF